MDSRFPRLGLPMAIGLGLLLAIYLVIFRPGYLLSNEDLELLIFLQILVGVLWRFRARFFPFLIVIFLGAGTDVPFQSGLISGRWMVLGAGAVAGLLICLRDRARSIGAFHMVAIFCVLAALLSATSSPESPMQAVLKSLSLLLLFLYGSFGARLAAAGRMEPFASGLLLGCEGLVYLLAIAYFIFHQDVMGNPNSLGLVTGVVALPVSLWGVLVSDSDLARRRRVFTFLLALLLLLSSYSRASMASGAVSCVLLCLVSRRYKLMMKGCAVAAVAAVLVVSLAPPVAESSGSVSSAFLYKGHEGAGLLDSRRSVWEKTISTIRQHPWLGTGFGTIGTTFDRGEPYGKFASSSAITREHGNSYLAIVEGVGLLGGLPFLTLILLVSINASRTLVRIRSSGDVRSIAFPIALILVAGVINAGFEDWLFAVGNYLCVFFWSLGFILVDLVPAEQTHPSYSVARFDPMPRLDHLGMVPPAR
jgi:O-antigen ligase